MPQLDKVTFASQFFWLCITFFSTYLILVKFYLPSLARIIKVRNAISNRSDESENVNAKVASPITEVYNSAIVASITAFQSRLEILEKWNSSQLQSIIPRLAPEFEQNIMSFQKEALISETILNSVVPPVIRPINGATNSATSKFFTASVSESFSNN